jgi:hypothetical protein
MSVAECIKGENGQKANCCQQEYIFFLGFIPVQREKGSFFRKYLVWYKESTFLFSLTTNIISVRP